MTPATFRVSPSIVLGSLALCVPLLLGGCSRNEAPRVRLADVERCERGIQAAVQKPDLAEGLRTYYRECANLYVEAGCREANLKAAELPQNEQLRVIADGCRQAYCPLFADRGLEICQGGAPATAAVLERNWASLHQAILNHDGQGLAPRISRSLVMFYAKSQQWLTPPAPSASEAPAGEVPPAPSGDVPPSASGAPPQPAASGSAPQPAASGSAPSPPSAAPSAVAPPKKPLEAPVPAPSAR